MTDRTAIEKALRKTARFILFLQLFIASALTYSQPSQLLLRNARIIVGDGRVLEQADLLIQGDTILSIGPAIRDDSVPIRSIDLSGKTIMPALIDGHAHLGYQSHASWQGDNYTRENLIDNLQQYAWYGFAAVFSAGSDADDMVLAIQRDQEGGQAGGARLLFAAGMAPPGQGPNNQFLVHTTAVARRTGMRVMRGIDSPEQAVTLADEVAAKGIRFVKIWVDDRNGSQEKLSPAVFTPLIRHANGLGLKVFVHHQFPSDMPALLDAGIGGFFHGRLGDDFPLSLAQAVAAQGAFIVPNLGLGELRGEAIGADPFLRAVLTDEEADRLAINRQRALSPARDAETERSLRDSMGRLLDTDVTIMLGTDAGGVADHPFGYTGHRELEIYVRLGMTPAQALIAGTSVAARELGLNRLGTLEPGKSADFIVLADNPLDDIRNTRSIQQVYLRGALLDRDTMSARWRSGRLATP